MKDKTKNIVVIVVFYGLLMSFFVINVFKKDSEISMSERRKLTQFKDVLSKDVFDGSFFEKFSSWTSDQFYKRDEFRGIKAKISLKIGNDYNNLYQYNDYLIEQTYPLNKNSVLNLTNKINSIKELYLNDTNNIYYTIIPDKNYFINDNHLKMDYSSLERIMKDNLQGMNYIDLFNDLTINDYYMTDTHWKEENLEGVAHKVCSNLKTNCDTTYQKKNITNFKGQYAYQLPLKTKEDVITILTNETIEKSVVYNYQTMKEMNVYDLTKKSYLDKYDIYLGGGVPLITISNQVATNDRELVVFRDSYGSSLVPLLIAGYSKITVIDTRYISPKILSNYITFTDKDILFMYSVILINNSFSLK